MEAALEDYGAAVATRLSQAGVEVATWDIGNEIDYGFAGVSIPPLGDACAGDEGASGWYRPPDLVNPAIGQETFETLVAMSEADRITWLSEELWPYTARLLTAVQAGIRSVEPDARFSTHLSGSATAAFALAFYDSLLAGGVRLDELGLSYYPTSSGETIAAFTSRVDSLVAHFGRPVFVAEYAHAAGDVVDAGPFGSWDKAVGPYEVTPEGSAEFTRDLVAWASAHDVSGIRPWAPDLGPIFLWGPLGLFDDSGAARPGLSAFQDGLLHGDPTRFTDPSPVWDPASVYVADQTARYAGSTWLASWWTRGQAPGDPYGPWQEITRTPNSTTAWTPSRIFIAGDQASYRGRLYVAKWWTRNQAPGDPYGPWRVAD